MVENMGDDIGNNEENKRYNKPKKLGDILNDMKINNQEGDDKAQNTQDIGTSITDQVSKILNNFEKTLNQIDLTHQEIQQLIQRMDAFFDEKSVLYISEIREQVDEIDKTLYTFDYTKIKLIKKMKSYIKQIPKSNYKEEQIKKIKVFLDLFEDIYDDIDNLTRNDI